MLFPICPPIDLSQPRSSPELGLALVGVLEAVFDVNALLRPDVDTEDRSLAIGRDKCPMASTVCIIDVFPNDFPIGEVE
jgi:hypothetical protein